MSAHPNPAVQTPAADRFPLAVALLYPTTLPSLGLRRKRAKAQQQDTPNPLKPQPPLA